jgi:hypothetical protein
MVKNGIYSTYTAYGCSLMACVDSGRPQKSHKPEVHGIVY